MARFGLDSSSDSEGSASDSSEPSRARSDSGEQDRDDGPPRASLMETDDDEDDSEDDSSAPGRSPSLSSLSSSGSELKQAVRAPVRAIRTAPVDGPTPWPKQLGLEPKRVAVMQASFFHQPTPTPVVTPSKPSFDSALVTLPLPTRTTFNTPLVEPGPAPASRKYTRVELDKSAVKDQEGRFVDSGLALGRSYRVGWGPGGRLVHMGSLYGRDKEPRSDLVTVDTIRMVAEPTATDTATMLRTLALQLEHTPIEIDDDLVPYPLPHPDLRFSHFCATLSPSDRSSEAQLWRLGHALFDEIVDLNLPEECGALVGAHLTEVRRRDLLEQWLADVVKGSVEEHLRAIASESEGKDTGAKRVFALLSGHQVERACEAALEANDVRLATLVAQAGGDDEYREDIYLQLAKWREYRVDAHISNDYRRVYEVLCGNVGVSEGVAKGDKVDGADTILISAGLDWKRALGIQLWYGSFQSSVATSLEQYQAATVAGNAVAPPLPLYVERPKQSTTTTWRASDEAPSDPLFQLIKIFTDPTHPLESALESRNFGSSPLDCRLPWHIYILFSRVLRRRDFQDRVDMGEDMEEGYEGNSVRADMVTESYAAQLELQGEWTWAAFILLHLELPSKRVQAIKALLGRNVKSIDDDSEAFLVEQLKIPSAWLFAAQAFAAKYNGDVFLEYQLLLGAKQLDEAHGIVVLELAPEAILRNDLVMLRRLLEPFDPRLVSDWNQGGKIFLDYAECVQDVAGQTTQGLDRMLLRSIQNVPSLMERSGAGLKLRVCVSEMQRALTAVATTLNKHAQLIKPAQLTESDRLVLLQGANSTFFAQSLLASM